MMLLRGVAALLAFACVAPQAEAVGVATASVDLGNEWLKIGLVKPGVPMDIVLNTESKRKTRVVIGLRNHERTFSDPGMTVATKYPKYAFTYLTELLGVQVDSDIVRNYQKRFPMHVIEPHPERGTVVFRLGEDETYTVEELMAQILSYAVSTAAQFAEQDIVGIVVTVPPYFNQAQRKAVLLVGKIANIKILQLLNSNTAVGINYGVFRSKTFNKTATNILFYDMGATSTVATVASYTTVKEKSQATSKGRTPQLEIKGVGYDRTLGGNSWDLKLREYLLGEFMKNKKVKGRDVAGDPRAMEKLAQSSEKVKRVLSANKETKAQIEGLYDEIDFKTLVTRDQFYNMTQDLFDRVAKPITDALDNANMTTSDIKELIIFGGGVRIPKVQDILKETMGVDALGKSINGDEAACLGASYRAAVLSKAFRVSKFLIKDINLYPLEMTYNKTKDGEVKSYTEKIFPRNHPTTKPKILLFNRSNDDFHFELNYGDLSFLTELERKSFGPTMLSAHNLTNLSATEEGHSNDTRKGVRVKFGIDDSGIAHVTGAEVVYEREIPPEPVEKSTLESLSDFFFGGSEGDNATGTNGTNATASDNTTADASDDKKTDADATGDDGKDTDKDSTTNGDDDAKSSKTETEAEESDSKKPKETKKDSAKKDTKDNDDKKNTEEKKDDKTTADKKTDDSDANNDDASTGNATGAADTNETASADEADKEPEKPKIVKIVEKVPFSAEYRDIADPSDEFVTGAQSRIATLVAAETERVEREAAYNNLESGLYAARDELSQEAFEAVSTEEQREKMGANLTALTEWLEEDGWQANASVLHAKIKELEGTMKSVRFRVVEAVERPAAVASLREGLNNTATFYARLVNYSNNLKENETEWHSQKELDDLAAIYNETLEWLDEKEALQNETKAHETPALFSRHITSKLDKLYREVSYLSKRPKPKPKKKKTPKNTTNDTTIDADGNETTDGDNTTATDDADTADGTDNTDDGHADGAADGDGAADEDTGTMDKDAEDDASATTEEGADDATVPSDTLDDESANDADEGKEDAEEEEEEKDEL